MLGFTLLHPTHLRNLITNSSPIACPANQPVVPGALEVKASGYPINVENLAR
jgi:hypothetical protein